LFFVAALLMIAAVGASSAKADLSDTGSGPTVTTAGESEGGGSGGSSQCASAPGCGIYDLINLGANFDWSNFEASGGPLSGATTALDSSASASAQEAAEAKYAAAVRKENLTDASPVQIGTKPIADSLWGYDVHDINGYPQGDGAIVGWQIEIWREGTKAPIFERRVCANADGTGTNAEGDAGYEDDWMDCNHTSPSATNGEFSANGQEAGFLTEESSAEKLQCRANMNNANHNTADGETDEAWALGYNEQRAYLNNPSNPSDGNFCYWQGSELGADAYSGKFAPALPAGRPASLQEAVYLHWTIVNTGVDTFEYAIDGPPGTLYAVDISAINYKNQLMPVFTSEKSPDVFTSENPDASSYGTDSPLSPNAVSESGFKASYFDSGVDPQYLRVFVPNSPNSNTCGDCTPPSDDLGQPQTTVTLQAQSPVQARTPVSQTVALSLDTPITSAQAVFPELSTLIHITPQNSFNGVDKDASCVTGIFSYCPDYVVYDSDTGIREPVSAGPLTNTGTQEALLPQVPALSVLSSNEGTISSNIYQTTWLQGTLDNPCADTEANLGGDESGDPGQGVTLPPNRSYCTTDGKNPTTQETTSDGDGQNDNTANVWDDYMAAFMTWESRWVSQESSATYGYITGALLRCDSQVGAVLTDTISSSGAVNNNCPTNSSSAGPFFPLSDVSNASAATQYAQGYLYAHGKGSSSTAAVRTYLDTPGPNGGLASNVTQMVMYNRDSGCIVGSDPAPAQSSPCVDSTTTPTSSNGTETANTQNNTRTGYQEMNFCTEGVGTGLKIYHGAPDYDGAKSSAHPQGYTLTTASNNGDPGCNGYAVHWVYSNSPSTCDVTTKNAPAPAVDTYQAPTALQEDPNTGTVDETAQNIINSWGIYGYETSESAAAKLAYSPSSWEADTQLQSAEGAAYAKAKTPPYTGNRPGGNDDTTHCDGVVSGHWTTGHWTHKWEFQITSSCSVTQVLQQYTSDTGSPTAGSVTSNALGNAESNQPAGAPAPTATHCNTTTDDPSSSGYNSAYPRDNPPATSTADDSNPPPSVGINYAVDEGQANGSGCPNSTSSVVYYNCNYNKSRPSGHRYVWTEYDLMKHKPTATNYYTFGYWYYQPEWQWGSSNPADAYDCSTSTSLTAGEALQEAGAGGPHYAGPLANPGDYGSSAFVYNYDNTSPDGSIGHGASGDTKYKNDDSNNWIGTTYTDDGSDVTGETGVSSGTYGSDASSGENSWNCTVIRHGGWQTKGGWVVGSGLTSDTQAAGSGDIFAGQGWGVNNTGPEVPNGGYNIQYQFGNLSVSDLADTGGNAACTATNPAYYDNTASAPYYCWALYADYDGRTDYQWSHETEQNDPNQPLSDAAISVFAPRDTR
jgi:hypothetical protein